VLEPSGAEIGATASDREGNTEEPDVVRNQALVSLRVLVREEKP